MPPAALLLWASRFLLLLPQPSAALTAASRPPPGASALGELTPEVVSVVDEDSQREPAAGAAGEGSDDSSRALERDAKANASALWDRVHRSEAEAEAALSAAAAQRPLSSTAAPVWEPSMAAALAPARGDATALRSSFLDSEAVATVMYARKAGPHYWEPWSEDSLMANVKLLLSSASPMDWYFLGVLLLLLVTMDLVVLQQLPETARTHAILLFFWLLVAVAFCMEIWLRLGPEAGTRWLTGYFLEVIFSIDNVFVIHLIFCTLETPRRLTAKAMFVGLLGSVLFRFALFMGLAAMLDRLRVIPYILGIWLVYCGTKQVATREEEGLDVTQTATVGAFRSLLGDRLGEFYDEEREAVLAVSGHKLRMTLLGVVVACLLSMDFFLALDVVLTKAEAFNNAYLNFSSSAVAMFAIRALFFVARDVFNRFTCAKYGIGLVLLFLGTELLIARSVYVNALMSCAVTALITVTSIGMSSLRGMNSKLTL